MMETKAEAETAGDPARPLQTLIDAARADYADCSDGSIQIDDDAAVAPTDSGVWVQAWVFVHKERLS